jgi:hypothetical protein
VYPFQFVDVLAQVVALSVVIVQARAKLLLFDSTMTHFSLTQMHYLSDTSCSTLHGAAGRLLLGDAPPPSQQKPQSLQYRRTRVPRNRVLRDRCLGLRV